MTVLLVTKKKKKKKKKKRFCLFCFLLCFVCFLILFLFLYRMSSFQLLINMLTPMRVSVALPVDKYSPIIHGKYDYYFPINKLRLRA